MNTIRAFIAVALPDEIKSHLDTIARALDSTIPRGAVRWVRPEQMHLTLCFLGDTAVDRLPAIKIAIDEVATENAPMTLHLDDLGCFPNLRRPRVMWVGLGGEEARLATLKAALDARLASLGWSLEDKPFRAHLTLGLVKDEYAIRGIEWKADVPRLEVPVAAIHLIESQLRPDGPIYTVRHSSRLSAGR